MNKTAWKIYAFWIIFVEAVGALSGVLSREGTEIYAVTIQQSPLAPPGILFPIVWTILYALMGISMARIDSAPPSKAKTAGILLFFSQLVFNFFWSIIFFNFQAFGFAFGWLIVLWILILLMIIFFNKVDSPAAKLQIPYLLWVTFAGYLNFGVWLLN